MPDVIGPMLMHSMIFADVGVAQMISVEPVAMDNPIVDTEFTRIVDPVPTFKVSLYDCEDAREYETWNSNFNWLNIISEAVGFLYMQKMSLDDAPVIWSYFPRKPKEKLSEEIRNK